MQGFVITVGVLNLGLGYLLAVVLANPARLSLRWPRWTWMTKVVSRVLPQSLLQRLSHLQDEAGAADAESESPALATTPKRAAELENTPGSSELPRSWLEELAAEGLQVESFVEGLMQSLRLEVGKYREHLIVGEGRLKTAHARRDSNATLSLVGDLRVINQDWLERQRAAAAMLSERRGTLGSQQGLGDMLEQLLLDQAAQIETICTNIAAVDVNEDIDAAARRLSQELAQLVDLAHALRDRMHDCVATMFRTQHRLKSIDSTLQYDASTGLVNRTGMEVLFDEWWREDPSRLRLLSCAVVDIDRFGKLNERLGTRTGDRVLHAFSNVLADLVRNNRGFDRFARLSGQSFLLFFGDIGPRNASGAAERIRQTLEATTFDYQGNKFEMTVSCGVLEVGSMEGVDDILRRLQQATREAKQAGRNRTAMDEGQGAQPIDPPQFQIPSRIVEVEDEVEVAATVNA